MPFANAAACIRGLSAGNEPPSRRHAVAGRWDRRSASPRWAATYARRRSSTTSGRCAAEPDDSKYDRGAQIARRVCRDDPSRASVARASSRPQPSTRPGCPASRPNALGPARPARTAVARGLERAFTGYLAIDRTHVPDDTPLFHQVLQSFDAADARRQQRLDLAFPAWKTKVTARPMFGLRRCRPIPAPGDWQDLDKLAYQVKKGYFARGSWRPWAVPCPAHWRSSSTPSLPRRAAFSVIPGG